LDEINTLVAERLRRIRRDAGLSLEDLSVRSGVSRAMLSQIETLKTNPTIAVIWKISRGLGVPFSELLGQEPAPTARVSRARDARFLFSADKAFRSRPLLANVPGHRVELYELRLEPGGIEQADPHPAGSFEHLFVSAGKVLLEVDSDRWELGEGDALLFRADRPHRYSNTGRKASDLMSLILYAG